MSNLGEIQVGPAIGVVIQHGHAASHALDEIFEARLPVEVLKIDSHLGVVISESDWLPAT